MDPSFELIKACIALLKADPQITDFVQNRIYDRVPENQDGTILDEVKSPYISLGNTAIYTENIDCIDAISINLQWNCWSWGDSEAYSSTEVRKLSFLVRKALNKKEINLDQNGFVSLEHQLTAYNRAGDGITNQASLNFEALVDIL